VNRFDLIWRWGLAIGLWVGFACYGNAALLDFWKSQHLVALPQGAVDLHRSHADLLAAAAFFVVAIAATVLAARWSFRKPEKR
jgi:hypothetical protein